MYPEDSEDPITWTMWRESCIGQAVSFGCFVGAVSLLLGVCLTGCLSILFE